MAFGFHGSVNKLEDHGIWISWQSVNELEDHGILACVGTTMQGNEAGIVPSV